MKVKVKAAGYLASVLFIYLSMTTTTSTTTTTTHSLLCTTMAFVRQILSLKLQSTHMSINYIASVAARQLHVYLFCYVNKLTSLLEVKN